MSLEGTIFGKKNKILYLLIMGCLSLLISSQIVPAGKCTSTNAQNTSTWYGASASTQTTITYDNEWLNNEGGGSRSFSIQFTALSYSGGEQIRITSMYLEIVISLSETYREQNGNQFSKTGLSQIISASNPTYSTSISVTYTGKASEISLCLTVYYDYYDGGTWWNGYSKSGYVCADVNTNEAPTSTAPANQNYDVDGIPSGATIQWTVTDVNDNLDSYEIFRKGASIKSDGCSDGDTVSASVPQTLTKGTYDYKLVITDEKGLTYEDIVYVGVGETVPEGSGDPSGISGFSVVFILAAMAVPICIKWKNTNKRTQSTHDE